MISVLDFQFLSNDFPHLAEAPGLSLDSSWTPGHKFFNTRLFSGAWWWHKLLGGGRLGIEGTM